MLARRSARAGLLLQTEVFGQGEDTLVSSAVEGSNCRQYHVPVSHVNRTGRDGSATHAGSLEVRFSGSLLTMALPNAGALKRAGEAF